MKIFLAGILFWRLSVIALLVAAGILAPLISAAIPWLILLGYMYLGFHPRDEERFGVPYNVFLALSLPLLFQPVVGTWLSPLLALPVLPLVDHSLRQFASKHEFKPRLGPDGEAPAALRGRMRPTVIARSLGLSLGIIVIIALVLGGWVLLLSTALIAAYLAAVVGITLYRNKRIVSGKPVAAELTRRRIIAGHTGRSPVKLILRGQGYARAGGYLSVASRQPWFSVKPARVVIDKPAIELEASFTPPLAGAVAIELSAVYIDPLGLLRLDFTFDIMEIFVIPRARYAEWMARRYLEMGRGGGREIANSSAATSRHASRRGIEFYGLRPYQPGDTARTIDWKRTSKLHQVIVKSSWIRQRNVPSWRSILPLTAKRKRTSWFSTSLPGR